MPADDVKQLSFDIADHIFTVEKGAKHLNLSKSYFYELVKAKKIKIVKIGKRTMVTGGEIRRYIQSL
jgi:excisionase family DNA binding protein